MARWQFGVVFALMSMAHIIYEGKYSYIPSTSVPQEGWAHSCTTSSASPPPRADGDNPPIDKSLLRYKLYAYAHRSSASWRQRPETTQLDTLHSKFHISYIFFINHNTTTPFYSPEETQWCITHIRTRSNKSPNENETLITLRA